MGRIIVSVGFSALVLKSAEAEKEKPCNPQKTKTQTKNKTKVNQKRKKQSQTKQAQKTKRKRRKTRRAHLYNFSEIAHKDKLFCITCRIGIVAAGRVCSGDFPPKRTDNKSRFRTLCPRRISL
jgi:mannitol-specific phosphotransferase system IIBC component